ALRPSRFPLPSGAWKSTIRPANTTPPRFHQAHNVQTRHGVAPAPSHSYLLYASAPPPANWSPDSPAPLVSRPSSLLPSHTESAAHLLPRRRRSSPYYTHPPSPFAFARTQGRHCVARWPRTRPHVPSPRSVTSPSLPSIQYRLTGRSGFKGPSFRR
ncbi:hypothetical protein C8R44DRAFT_982883, partial [Mycena epipterygia]